MKILSLLQTAWIAVICLTAHAVNAERTDTRPVEDLIAMIKAGSFSEVYLSPARGRSGDSESSLILRGALIAAKIRLVDEAAAEKLTTHLLGRVGQLPSKANKSALASHHHKRGRIEEAAGDREAALRSYRKVEELLGEVSPTLAAKVKELQHQIGKGR